MVIRVVRLGTERVDDEGVRIGTVRRPPRGVPKVKFASDNWYDVWYPNLAPSVETMQLGLHAQTLAEWNSFVRKYKAEMAEPEAAHSIALLASLSHHSNFSIGCYCEDESRCHRSILRELLAKAGASMA
jgi:uncharacterized protein YeaO (DUF488 family)